MTTYINSNNQRLYDANMIAKILRVNMAYLKREMKKYRFSEGSYIKYFNRHLYNEIAVINFISFLVKEQIEKEIKKMERAAIKIMN